MYETLEWLIFSCPFTRKNRSALNRTQDSNWKIELCKERECLHVSLRGLIFGRLIILFMLQDQFRRKKTLFYLHHLHAIKNIPHYLILSVEFFLYKRLTPFVYFPIRTKPIHECLFLCLTSLLSKLGRAHL